VHADLHDLQYHNHDGADDAQHPKHQTKMSVKLLIHTVDVV
jgi:hypothetical protein